MHVMMVGSMCISPSIKKYQIPTTSCLTLPGQNLSTNIMASNDSQPKEVKAPENSQAVPKRLVIKILFFTAVILFGPSSEILQLSYGIHSFLGNKVYAAGLAAVMANIGVVVYLVAAFAEDSAPQEESKEKES
ncbi:hypothetical protein K493DRAFT_404435 [Basidiobolus meristosporus CBS 931.73]|uniref:Vacuolar ATPase assembly integral membrane protein VMA21 n=1 Tax=Basidiobolus meristosporus CBS 931.73 TaxID=1314790 RepID=A0A1Y1Z4R7_9FUNG|nr:hypothetical protein K493DRAFT_404435 [Basidiobolus meristosporus CBS 931.73]|eukprot:ORY05250.1 hypothetical protein K493DRAFT_404435 [Basidiobolus meristosporus CBS 931.73]